MIWGKFKHITFILPFISFFCLIAVMSASSKMLSRNVEGELLCLVFDLRRKHSVTIKYNRSCAFFIDGVLQVQDVIIYS